MDGIYTIQKLELAAIGDHGKAFTWVQDGAPPVISWFVHHEITPINYSYIYHKPLLNHL